MKCDQKIFDFDSTIGLESINYRRNWNRDIKALQFWLKVDVKRI